MNSTQRKNALLPSGFEDLLPPQAELEYAAIGELMRKFSSFGYERIKPPMAEFEESLLGEGPGSALAQETFRVMDPVTHRMMALRSDITAQIARIAQTRLIDEPRPLRLTYANDVIRTKASQQRTLRQFTQVGCEMIGLDNADSDIEIALVALCGLHSAGVKEVTLDFSIPRLTDLIMDDLELTSDDRRVVGDALKSRAQDGLFLLGNKKAAKIYSELLKICGPADQVLKSLKNCALPKSVKPIIQRLEQALSGVRVAMDQMDLRDASLTVDPLETKGFDYHNGVAFTLFAKGARGEIGRGGRYTIFNGAQDAGSAAGFTLYMDGLRQIISQSKKRRIVFVPATENWGVVKKLQDDGWSVLRGFKDKNDSSSCSHVLRNGKIEEIS